MKREEIIRMAREAGLILLLDEDCFQRMGVKNFERTKRVIEHFASLVAAAEREACAKVCDDLDDDLPDGLAGWQYGEAIRARSNT